MKIFFGTEEKLITIRKESASMRRAGVGVNWKRITMFTVQGKVSF